MPVSIKSEREINLMREAGNILAILHDELERMVEPGITTMHLNRRAEAIIREYGCIPSFLNYEGYPASICISVNDEVVHGIPNKSRILHDGDIVSIDAGVIYQGYQSDAARTHPVGDISEEAKRLIQVTKDSFYEGVRYARADNRIYQISQAVQDYVEENGYSVVRALTGHGIGRELHEAPQIPNFKTKRKGVRMQPGMTLAIEPMVNMGDYDVWFLEDDWTVVTKDGSLSAHYEHTVLVTEGEPELLSVRR